MPAEVVLDFVICGVGYKVRWQAADVGLVLDGVVCGDALMAPG